MATYNILLENINFEHGLSKEICILRLEVILQLILYVHYVINYNFVSSWKIFVFHDCGIYTH